MSKNNFLKHGLQGLNDFADQNPRYLSESVQIKNLDE